MNEETSDEAARTRPRRRGVFLLPNLFTTGVLFSGFFAVVSAINGDFITAAIA
ncbi:MAG: CDP-diacylglycerol--serine O-phosphatidyltransferase, partial [Thioalkalivibrio sp.]|nr:CDP-diacylglycerol--serine O-phosphatidyltransferase [Thioalkalivibrio sp.]